MDIPDKAVNAVELRKEVEALRLRVAELEASREVAQKTDALRLRQAYALARLGTWEWETSTDRVTWSGDMFRIYGIRPEEFTGKGSDYFQSTRADYRALQQHNMEAAWKNGVTEESFRAGAGHVGNFKELCIVRPDGTECYTLEDAVCIVDADGKPLRMLGITVDITESKRAEQSLQESEQKYRILVEESPDPISLYTPEFILKFVNRAFADAYGHPVEHIVGKRFGELLPREEAEPREAALREVFCSGKRHEVEFRLPQSDGCHTYFLTLVPIKDGAGAVISVIGISKDITALKRTEEQLCRSEAKLRRAQTAAHMGSWTWYPKSNRVEWSDEMYRVFGVDPCKFTGDLADVIARAIHPDDRGKVDESNLAVVREGKAGSLEYRVVWPDQSVHFIWAEAGDITRDDSGNVVVLSGYAQDITDRKRAEAALRESQQRFQSILDNASMLVYTTDLEGRLTLVNRQFESLFGVPREQLLGKTSHDLMPKQDADAHRANDLVVMAKRDTVIVEEKNQEADGPHTYLTTKFPLFDIDGKMTGVCGISTDITERKRAEAELMRSEALMRTAIENLPLIFYMIDGEGIFRLSIGAGLKGLGLEQNQVCGLSAFEIYRDFPGITNAIRETLAGNTATFESRVGGSSYSNICVPYCASDGSFSGLVAVALDITVSKKAEEEKAKLEAQLQQAQKMESVGRLAGGVAHDFNNMLGVILGHAEMAMENMDPAEASLRGNLEEIRKAAQRSANLTRQLLAFARKQTVAPKVLDLNETVASMLKMLRRLVGEDVNLVWLPGTELYPVKVDPSQVDQILANLCVNARDAIGGIGKLTIETANSTFDDDYCATHAEVFPGEYVKLAVTDDGCGMDKATQERIFEPFFTTKGVGKGTGLGLATVYGIVKQNNGFIKVTSEPDKGTTFEICLPRHGTAKTGPAQTEPLSVPVARGRETILVVEDEPAILDMTKTMLERLGYTVLIASTAREAIRLAGAHTGLIHLLMTDVVMPEMNGRDLAKNLLNSYPALKRLFMSGHTADVIARHGVLEEGVHFIQKPFSKKDLAAKVSEVLERG